MVNLLRTVFKTRRKRIGNVGPRQILLIDMNLSSGQFFLYPNGQQQAAENGPGHKIISLCPRVEVTQYQSANGT